MAKSTRKGAARKALDVKPAKPHPDFPLFAHATGRWAKKVKGKLHYFGKWADPQAALEKWLQQKDDLLAGRTPRVTGDGLTVRDLANKFLNSKRLQVAAGELTARSWADYYSTCERVVKVFGKNRLVDDLAADDFEKLRSQIAETRGAVALGNEVQRVRTLFKYAYDAGLMEKPVRFGPAFKKPSAKTVRKERNGNGQRMFEADELRRIVEAARQPLRAMILLGVNCGFGNSDVATLPTSAVNLETGWIDYPRPKTAIHRRCWLWPETIEAVKAAITERPRASDKADDALIFLTVRGAPWTRVHSLPTRVGVDDARAKATAPRTPVTKEFRKLLDTLGLHRRGLGFYTLRHVFATIGGESRDQVAVNGVMGHAPSSNDMASVYRERISDDRLRAVAEHVRTWLFDARPPATTWPASIANVSATIGLRS